MKALKEFIIYYRGYTTYDGYHEKDYMVAVPAYTPEEAGSIAEEYMEKAGHNIIHLIKINRVAKPGKRIWNPKDRAALYERQLKAIA